MNRRFWINAALAAGVFFAFVAVMWYFAWRPARIIDAKNGFSIRFTAEWEVAGEGEGATLRALRTMGVGQGGGTGVINVWVSPISNIPDATAYRGWFVEHMAGLLGRPTVTVSCHDEGRSEPQGRIEPKLVEDAPKPRLHALCVRLHGSRF